MRYIRNATIINDGQRMTINELLLITSQNLPHAKIYILYNIYIAIFNHLSKIYDLRASIFHFTRENVFWTDFSLLPKKKHVHISCKYNM